MTIAWWLIKNYFKLISFMNISINPFAFFFSDILLWKVSYKLPYYILNKKQKQLSDEYWNKLKKIEGL